jgi:hypothetical protein
VESVDLFLAEFLERHLIQPHRLLNIECRMMNNEGKRNSLFVHRSSFIVYRSMLTPRMATVPTGSWPLGAGELINPIQRTALTAFCNPQSVRHPPPGG